MFRHSWYPIAPIGNLLCERVDLPVPHEPLPRQLPDQALHFQAEQRDRYGRAGEAALADYVVNTDLLIVQRVIDLLLVVAWLQRGQDAGLAGGR